MVPDALLLLAATDAVELVRGTTIAVVTLVVVVLAVGVGAFILLFRRGGDRGIRGSSSQTELDAHAAALLVSLDDRVRDSENEVGFAIAQFGAASVQEFTRALTQARQELTEAFRLGQQRDIAVNEADRSRRRTTLQMIALCEKALLLLERFDSDFTERRRTEAAAGGTVIELTQQLSSLREHLVRLQQQQDEAAERYLESVLAVAIRQRENARQLLDNATQHLDVASPEISETGVNAVAELLHLAASDLHRAAQQLSASELTLAEASDAEVAVTRMRDTSMSDLREARVALDRAQDPDTASGIITAIAAVDNALTGTAVRAGGRHDPFRQLIVLTHASAELDNALATARNQQQRFEHARAAYRGTVLAARSQINIVKEMVGRGGVSANARTRLAEAERQLMIAEAETDPVEALDAIRRSVTHARDADALARY
ncbi:hypothetical protein [Salinibacterium sp. M195]|uniref:hypothetical protein n=1 Tax=Salinibacterium sp. M195 TaxID=2583374 RepID=UPI001C633739|nr:hypothetical protein [Salinibacterium sp. M195]QYH35574.1 hypothetical protein FFT87_06185 [Salinibacterium sp. M195]